MRRILLYILLLTAALTPVAQGQRFKSDLGDSSFESQLTMRFTEEFYRTWGQIEADLGDSSFVSLLTMGPGEEFYTSWGHSAIRICDSTIGLDVVYNYGTFDFNTDWFYLKFARGQLNYCLSRGSYEGTLKEYQSEGRALWEQRLDLTRQERNNLLIMLEENYKPEFRYYKYDFFRDNCATRVRDKIQNCLCHRTLFEAHEVLPAKTYRNLVYEASEEQLWWRLGVDLLLGARCDRPLNSMEYMFSPLELHAQMDTARLADGGPMAIESRQVLPEQFKRGGYTPHPTLCFWLMFVAVLSLTIIGWAKKKRMVWLDEVLFWVAGLVSLLLIFMWFGTSHYCTKANWNLLWANPLLIYFACCPRCSHKVALYIGLSLEFLTVALFWLLPQQLNAAVIPIALTLFVRILDKIKNKD